MAGTNLPYTSGVIDLNALPLPALFGELTKDGSLARLLAACRDEDLGSTGDVTTQSCVSPGASAKAALIAREPGVIAGLATVLHVLSAFEAEVWWNAAKSDGETCNAGEVLGSFEGLLAGLLTAERTMLNLVARMCGTATLTRRFVDAVNGTQAQICDTRKTSPGMRSMQKYAVRCGGGYMHRVGLYDALLYKDNHLANIPAGELTPRLEGAIRKAMTSGELRFVEIEAESLDQFRSILALPKGLVHFVLLDNMPLEQLRAAVELRRQLAPHVKLEASGGVTLESVRTIAETGVDRISVGALTHAAPALDLAIEVEV
jgi:nicotinate-nucleotide pyrophosphorylase (carboxylating)